MRARNNASLAPKNKIHTEAKQNRKYHVESSNYPHKESDSNFCKIKKGFKFSQSNLLHHRPRLASGTDYFMQSCRDIQVPHLSDNCADTTMDDVKYMLRQSLSMVPVPIVTPLPPSPLEILKSILTDQPEKNSTFVCPGMTVAGSEIDMASESQELLNVDDSTVPNSFQRSTFCHQESNGFGAPTDQTGKILKSDTYNSNNYEANTSSMTFIRDHKKSDIANSNNYNSNTSCTAPIGDHQKSKGCDTRTEKTIPKCKLDAGNSNNLDANTNSNNYSLPLRYKFSVGRTREEMLYFDFEIHKPISLKIDLRTSEVYCGLGQHFNDTPYNGLLHVENANIQAYGSFTSNLVSSEKNEPIVNNVSTVELESPPLELVTPILKSSEQSNFVSVENSNLSKLNNLNYEVSEKLCELSSPKETNNLLTNEVNKDLIQESSDFYTTNSISSPLQKSPEQSSKSPTLIFKSTSESYAKTFLDDLKSISDLNGCKVKANFPGVSLSPLPLCLFGSSDEKINTFSPTKSDIDEGSVESQGSPSLKESPKISVSKIKEGSKSTFVPKNRNTEKTVNNAKTNITVSFNHENVTNDSFLDLLLIDEEKDCNTIATSYSEAKENFSSHTGIANNNSPNKIEVKGSATSSGHIISSTSNSFEPVSEIHSNIDMVINDVTVGDISEMGESVTSTQVDSGSIVPSTSNSLKAVSNDYSNVDIINGVSIGCIEIEVETQDPHPRILRKRQNPTVNSSHQANKKLKGNLKSINLIISKESSMLDYTKHVKSPISDVESRLIIAEDFEEIEQSIPISNVESSEKKAMSLVTKNYPNESINKKQTNRSKTLKKSKDTIDSSHIEAAFQALDKIRFTEAHFRLHVHKLVTLLINPSVLESTLKLVFHLVKYLHTTKKNPMLSFFLSNDPDTLLPTSEKCIVNALLAVRAKNKPHLNGLLACAVETLHLLALGKAQYHIYGSSSLCRVMTAICKELNDPSKPRSFCCDVLKYSHKFAPFLIASSVGVYKEAFQISPNSTVEEKIFISALSYGVQHKPKTLTETQWKYCNKVFSEYLIPEFETYVSEIMPILLSAIKDKCLTDPYQNEYLLTGPLVIYARVKGWNWAQEHLLEDYILPNLQIYSEREDGERAFSLFSDLYADICYGCPDQELSQTCLMKYFTTPCEREFVQIRAAAALFKLILLRKELFPEEIRKWTPHHENDPRIQSCYKYFMLRLMDEQELAIYKDNAIV